ncbi:hypothetical protein EJB05_41458, partial [Eragrostis curvula]
MHHAAGHQRRPSRTEPRALRAGCRHTYRSDDVVVDCRREAERPCPPPKRRGQKTGAVGNMWRQVQGSDDWDGLLQPLHPVVRDEVARYGKLVDACYDALDMHQSSARHMCCKHGKESLLDGAGTAGRGYEVTRYIYATLDVAGRSSSSCVGYVAVSTDEMTRRLGRRDVLVAFRGTVTQAEWAANLMSSLKPARLDARDARPDVKVESGFLNLYTSAGKSMGSCREQLLREVSRLITLFSKKDQQDMSVTLAGHSMGSALATLLGYDLAELGLLNRLGASGRRVPVTVFSFGGPRVGNAAFKARCDELGVKALRVANVRDPVTMVPGLFGGAWGGGDCYTHVGVELTLDFLRLGNLGSVHDLGTYVASLQAETGGKQQVVSSAANWRPDGQLLRAGLSWFFEDQSFPFGSITVAHSPSCKAFGDTPLFVGTKISTLLLVLPFTFYTRDGKE